MSDYKPSEKEMFVNPYHFVRLQDSCTRKAALFNERKGDLTGWVQCRLETLTPVFIPNTGSIYEENGEKKSDVFKKRILKEKENKTVIVNSYDFFSYTDLSALRAEELKEYREPVIPGSEIRGVIRSAFETVTNSCLSTIDDEQLLYKRVQTPAKPGRLVFDKSKKGWVLYECNRNPIHKDLLKKENNEPYKEGESVYVQIDFRSKSRKVLKISKKMQNGFKNAFLHIGEYNENKNYETVFMLKKDRKTNRCITGNFSKNEAPSILNNLIQNILLYREKENKTENHNQYRHFDRTFGNLRSTANLVLEFEDRKINYDEFLAKLKKEYEPVFKFLDGALVYYTRHGENYYLSPAAIGREIFYNRLTDIIKDYTPCGQLSHLCPACALFGLAGREGAAASRVRFTDAHAAAKLDNMKDYYDEDRILKELAGPKLSASEFYLKKNPDNAHLWNYDYAIKWKTDEDRLPGYIPEIRGRKFYWHHPDPKPYIDKDKENNHEFVSDRNVVVRPLQKGISFDFKVYFNDITENELKRLLWVLTIGNKKENAHKIGMAKPLGLGSVKINVLEVNIRDISMKNSTIEYTVKNRLEQFNNLSGMNHEELGCSSDVLDDFLFITGLKHSFKGPIEYPSNVDEPKTYEWFMANKKVKGKGTTPIIENSLPSVKEPELPKYIRTIKKNKKW